MKAFLALALPEDHPFWQAEEKPYTPPEKFLDEQVRLLLCRDGENRQVLAYTAGNHAWEHMHEDEKYEKFAYSTKFAFSVIKEATTLEKGAYDSMLAVKRTGKCLWHGRSGCESFALGEDRITFTWSPLEGVRIETVIVPWKMWHIRRHVIFADFPVEIAEGAFAVRRDWAGDRPCDRIASAVSADGRSATAHGDYGTSGIFALSGYETGVMIWPEPNTNLMYPRTVLPMLRGTLPAGKSVLMCAVCADADDRPCDQVPEEVLNIAESL